MATVLRGGKWGRLQSRSASNTTSVRRRTRDPRVDAANAEADAQHVILCFVEERKHLGVATYDPSANEIQVSKVSCAENFDDAARIVSSLDKCHVVLPASYKDNDKMFQALSEAKRSVPDSQQDKVPETREGSRVDRSSSIRETAEGLSVFYLPNHDFGLRRATELCSLITVRDMPSDLNPDERISFLSHVLQDDPCIMRCVGGLLSFIIGNGILGSLTDDDDSIYLNGIRHQNHGDVVRVTTTTLRALNVFSQDTHPVGRGTLRGKEGFSLFGIIKSYTKTPAARKMLRAWLHYPSTNVDTIEQRLFLVNIFQCSPNRAFLVTVKESLRGVKNVPGVLNRLKRVSADVNDWKALYSSAKSYVSLLETLKVAAQQNQDLLKSSLIAKITAIAEPHLRSAVSWMDAVVDFEESTIQGRLIVAPGFSEEIDELKRSYSALDDFLTKIGVEELRVLLDKSDNIEIESLNATYEPQIGFLIALSETECEKIGHCVLEEVGLSFVFRSEEHRYFKNERCRELDVEPGDIHGLICDLEAKAFRYLETKIFESAPFLLEMFQLVTQLDCLQAIASAAADYGWVRPTVSAESKELEIEDGRHPLLELTVPSYVPNSTKMRSGDVHIVTGPNFSGKSVYLSQVALIVILAQIGSFVPAKKAKIGVVGAINGRITSFDSVTSRHSSFFTDVTQVVPMTKKTPEISLNLIDEFGKGTSEVDGMALLASALRALLRQEGDKAPFTICATHFYEILKEPFLPMDTPRLGFYSMEVMTQNLAQPNVVTRGESRLRLSSSSARPNRISRSGYTNVRSQSSAVPASAALNDISTVVRTYRLLHGSICNESRALQCALEAGVPKYVLQRAANIRSAIEKGEKIENMVATPANNPRIKICVDMVREFMASTKDGNTGS